MLEDTIVAIATPLDYGGLGIVRMSGRDSLSIAKKIFIPRNQKEKISPKKAVLGNFTHPDSGQPFEEAYLLYFQNPASYTREDMIEMTCHGSPVILEEIIRICCQSGARLADPGEFTLRAFLNGRIDIIQAEAINDLIHASTFSQAQISFTQMDGRLSRKLMALRNQFIHLLTQIEASIEFPDEGLPISSQQIKKTLGRALQDISALVSSYETGRSMLKGITLAIAGKTNVGKSTLFNSLLERERAVVTAFPGTTRDYLQEKIRIKDVYFTLTDIAGVDRTSHPVEKMSIKKGSKIASDADGILLVFDVTRKITSQDKELIKKHRSRRLLFLFNKIDLKPKMEIQEITSQYPEIPFLQISALKGTHLEDLKKLLYTTFGPKKSKGEEIIFHLHQKIILEKIEQNLLNAKNLLEQGYTEEFVAEEIKGILPQLGQLSGEIKADDLLKNIFSRFCVGK